MGTNTKEAALDPSTDFADVCDFQFDRQCRSFLP